MVAARPTLLFGCQGTGINAFSGKKAEAWHYLQFWQSKETQAALMADAPSGFFSARTDLRDQATQPWQTVFLDSIPLLRDIWNVPEYAQLLQILQTELNLAYVGQKTRRMPSMPRPKPSKTSSTVARITPSMRLRPHKVHRWTERGRTK